jgi:CRP-like cAMP-binding protein
MASHLTAGDLQIVKSIALFRSLEPETVKHIIAPATPVTMKSHTTLFRQGEVATAFFIMIDGWTKHYRLNVSGDEAVTHVLTKGDSFAESIALTRARFPATAETVTDARIVRVPADHVIRCIQENPNIALAMIASTSQRLRDLMMHIEQLKAKSGVQRLAEFLATLAPVNAGPCSIALPYDKTLIAARLGLTPESLSRIFGKLRVVGVVVHSAHVAVRDVARLQRLATDQRSAIRGAFHEAP